MAGAKAQKVRFRLWSYDYKQIDSAVQTIVGTARRTGVLVRGPVPLPARRERFDLLRSPHVDKKSREQIEIRTYSRLIDIVDPSPKTVDELAKLELPAAVHFDIKVD